jgi:hypothetical protein
MALYEQLTELSIDINRAFLLARGTLLAVKNIENSKNYTKNGDNGYNWWREIKGVKIDGTFTKRGSRATTKSLT